MGRPLKRFRISGHVFDCDLRSPLLDGYATGEPAAAPVPAEEAGFSVVAFRGCTPVAGRERDVECRWGSPGCRLSIEDAGVFFVAPDGASIRVRGLAEASPESLFQTLVGPALIVAMALRGSFCLHASAVAIEERAIAFVGRSGSGKSTLAAALPALAGSRWRRLADDVLPISSSEAEGVVQCRSDFPQLKLGPAAERPAPPPQIQVCDFYLLQPPPAPGTEEIVLRNLDGAEAAFALIGHGVGTPLFPEPLLAEHFSFCSALAARARVRELSVPWSKAALPRLAAILEEEMETEG